jgi:hypothetical protein
MRNGFGFVHASIPRGTIFNSLSVRTKKKIEVEQRRYASKSPKSLIYCTYLSATVGWSSLVLIPGYILKVSVYCRSINQKNLMFSISYSSLGEK